jgi:hypothetical protein
VSVDGFAFQACSFNHSDISPFRINNLRTRKSQNSGIMISPPMCSRSLTGFSSIAAPSPLGEMADRVNPAELRMLEPASKLASATVC